ncbi:Dienelactone hydrolase [Robiginitalea myxolifaciens]|uniref:Dienelactone hydrolase n=1 Tax=Robiginitalea myxolifaciens TaxID=400055 RepID=A0A1I6HD43_9FLAO|nr:hypothetical protein [Robiginitalea myxolifaciens]SFR52260.1 Dienelactone hydrolase [Robiginitalea myxolifaciens]
MPSIKNRIVSLYQRIYRWLQKQITRITPGSNALKGAAIGGLVLGGLFWLLFYFLLFLNVGDPWLVAFFVGFLLAALLAFWAGHWLLVRIAKLPRFFLVGISLAGFMFSLAAISRPIGLVLLGLSALLGAAFWVLRKTGFRNLSIPKKIITLLGLVIGLGGFITLGIFYSKSGFDVKPISAIEEPAATDFFDLPTASPALKGPYTVKTLTYGSGKDLRRPEFGEAADIITDSVNGLAFIDDWSGFTGWWRTKYWGFDSRALPLNARVWYPEGDGPFPLALIVHGNHHMQDFSDPGYAYLGELLASRGIILASVDENFINSTLLDIFGGLEEENDARAWLLLEHLKQWHTWNQTDGHIFQGKIDTDKLALIGHSRGGEAVAIAAMFNALPYYPDDAAQRFDYNFNLKGVVAIAPVDGQYEPGKAGTAFENVDYLVMHGAQDADVSSFAGSQQYERIKFTDSSYHFKSGLYVVGANHGQFNTSWGKNDLVGPFEGLLNFKQLLPAEEQRQIAEVYISGFLEASLNAKKEYLPLFMDARLLADWLPDTHYFNQFEDSETRLVSSFDEDFDLSSTSIPSGSISSENLTVWREEEIRLKWNKKGSRAAFVGWHYDLEEAEQDSTAETLSGIVADSAIARYTLDLPLQQLDSTAALVFSLAESKESSNPKSQGKWVANQENESEDTDAEEANNENSESGNANVSEEEAAEEEEGEDDAEEKDAGDKTEKAAPPLDLTIQLTDSTGQRLSFPLSRFTPLKRQVEVVIAKVDFAFKRKQSEKVFQSYYFPLAILSASNPDFDPTAIRRIEFVFDRSPKGVIIIDHVGFTKALSTE